ncbi:MAG: FadR family transcriptional regulator, partial [Verrucomicrobia bacterium]|nr:FadR family transcriptional regulator [Verrucomicrobiota bacterium]
MSSAIQSISVVDAIERCLKQKIANGLLTPGQQLPSERELQAELGVSRLPLREALARLQALGLIRIRHGKGAFVERGVSSSAMADVLIAYFPHHDERRLRDLVEARGLLESELSALASERASPGELAELENLLHSHAAAVRGPGTFADLDYAFHHQIAQVAGNSFLLLMHEALGPHIRSFLQSYAQSEADRRKAHDRNLSLLEAIKSRQPKLAAETARNHLKPCLASM